jgi:hypothetical protein
VNPTDSASQKSEGAAREVHSPFMQWNRTLQFLSRKLATARQWKRTLQFFTRKPAAVQRIDMGYMAIDCDTRAESQQPKECLSFQLNSCSACCEACASNHDLQSKASRNASIGSNIANREVQKHIVNLTVGRCN